MTRVLFLITVPLIGQIPNPFASDASPTTPAERLALLRPVCGDRANENGCSTCPPGTDFPNDSLRFRGVIYGHFLGQHSYDAAVGFFGCESHASGLGGAFLLTRENGAWKQVSFRPAAIVDDCRKLRAKDGHDVLICFGADNHQDVEEFLYLLDFKTPWDDEHGLDIFFSVTDTTWDCTLFSLPDSPSSGGFVFGAIQRVSFVHGDRIIVEARLGRIAPAQFEKVANECHPGNPARIFGLHLATVRKTYRFFFDGTSVRAAPGNPPMAGTEAIAPVTRLLPRPEPLGITVPRPATSPPPARPQP